VVWIIPIRHAQTRIPMKYAPAIVGGLLGLLFIASGASYFFMKDMPMPFPEGSPPAQLMAVWGTAGFLTFVKVFEILGGLLLAIPRTRNFGLLVLGPIIINILAFHGLIAKAGLLDPTLIVICVLTLFLLWSGRKAFAGLLN
jgi:uncharacterized membrane protein YphA (DoxX/SURF4 family)